MVTPDELDRILNHRKYDLIEIIKVTYSEDSEVKFTFLQNGLPRIEIFKNGEMVDFVTGLKPSRNHDEIIEEMIDNLIYD